MKKKNRAKKIIAAALAAAILAGGGVTAGVLLSKNSKPVNVYSLYEIGQTDMWMDASQYDGEVRSDNLQNVYLSDTQLLKEVYVKEGDVVKKGDRLALFDTTLSEIELEKQKIEVEKLKLSLTKKQAQLREINSMKPYVPPTPKPAPEPEILDPVQLPHKISGDGTEATPFVYLWDEGCSFNADFINSVLPLNEIEEETDAPEEDENTQAAGKQYAQARSTVVFQVREYNNPKGALLYSWGMVFNRLPDGNYEFTVFEPDIEESEDDQPDDYLYPDEIDEERYTASEIAQMRVLKQQEIKNVENLINVESLKLRRLELEINSGVITAQIDGVIKSVLTEEEASSEYKPIITLSADGALYIDTYIGELELEDIAEGSQVNIESWMGNGLTCEGKVVEISLYPATSQYGYNGNPNISVYPVTVEVDPTVTMQDGDYVSVSYNTDSSSSGLYLEAPFILKENGKSYVYAMDENEKLEKREIVTGKIYWGSTIEIVNGLSMEDYIAFPYGKDVKSGAKTEISDVSELYEGMYYY